MSKKRLQEGDIFYIERKGKYFFGKILLDISNRILNLENENVLGTFSSCYMVCIYKGIYDNPELTTIEPIIPSAFAYKKYFYSKKYKIEWTFYDNEPIDYKKLDFPESLIRHGGKGIYFTKGELELKTNFTGEDYFNDYKILKSVIGTYDSLIDIACHYQNRDDLMEMKYAFYLETSDFRFAPKQRKEAYKQIGEVINQSYYEMALKHGLDLARFYK